MKKLTARPRWMPYRMWRALGPLHLRISDEALFEKHKAGIMEILDEVDAIPDDQERHDTKMFLQGAVHAWYGVAMKPKMWCGECGRERKPNDRGKCVCGCNWRSTVKPPFIETSVMK